jgi:hypothetical protein
MAGMNLRLVPLSAVCSGMTLKLGNAFHRSLPGLARQSMMTLYKCGRT